MYDGKALLHECGLSLFCITKGTKMCLETDDLKTLLISGKCNSLTIYVGC